MLVINEQEIIRSYGMKEAIQDITDVLKAKEAEKIANPHRTVIEFPQHGNFRTIYAKCRFSR